MLKTSIIKRTVRYLLIEHFLAAITALVLSFVFGVEWIFVIAWLLINFVLAITYCINVDTLAGDLTQFWRTILRVSPFFGIALPTIIFTVIGERILTYLRISQTES